MGATGRLQDYVLANDVRTVPPDPRGYSDLAANREYMAILGTGLPHSFLETTPEFGFGFSAALQWIPESLRTVPLPGPVAVLDDNKATCADKADDTDYEVRQYSDLVDLTADGIPDYVFFGKFTEGPDGFTIDIQAVPPIGTPADRQWWVMVGTGLGYRAPQPISAPSTIPFEIFRSWEKCGGYMSRVTGGLADVDGDGHLEVLRVGAWNFLDTTQVNIARLVGTSGAPNAYDAGLLARVENGYGAATQIEYGSAKEDGQTPHDLPYPEIVVTAVVSSGEHLAVSYEPTRYAYGDAQQFYHPLLGRWIFPGYGRRVSLRGVTDASGRITGRAEITDSLRVRDLPAGFETYGRAGALRDVVVLSGTFDGDPRALLTVDVAADGRVIGNQHFDYRSVNLPEAAVVGAEECGDVRPYAAVPTGADPALCRKNAIVLASTRDAWEGIALPDRAVRRRSEVLTLDLLGRPLTIMYHNDVNRTDDDLCEEFTYAQWVSQSGVPKTVGAAVAAQRLTNCVRQAGSGRKVYAGVRYRYDSQAEGVFSKGLLTHVIVERYHTATGLKLDEFVYESRVPDGFGNLRSSNRTHAGKTMYEYWTYDAFGEPTAVEYFGSDVAKSLLQRFAYDPVSRTRTVTDENSVIWKRTADGHGRTVRSTMVESGLERILWEVEYYDDPAALGGRRVVTRRYNSADGTSTGATEEIAYLDEFDRVRYVEHPLGMDYAGEALVSDYAEYDTLGRRKFIADPFTWSESAVTRYGTSFQYHPDGRLHCSVRGVGYQSSITPSTTEDRYPTCMTYDYRSGQAITKREGPQELLSGTPQYGAYDEVAVSAIGRVIWRTRGKGTSTLDYVDFVYDRLGNTTQVRRSSNPLIAGSPLVTWSYEYDSLGRELTALEPGTSPVSRTFDEWGNELTSTITDTTVVPNLILGTRSEYDAFGRLRAEEQTRSAVGSGITTVDSRADYYYDAAATDGRHVAPTLLKGRLAYVRDAARTTYLGYDPFGRIIATSRVDKDDPSASLFTEMREYGVDGQVETLTFMLPDTGYEAETATYTYDSARRVRTVDWQSSPLSPAVTMFNALNVTPRGQYLQVDLGNGVREEFTYRPERRRELQTARVTFTGGEFTTWYGSYDGQGRLASRTETFGTETFYTTYEYDDLWRLARVYERRDWLLTTRDDRFTYDALGNLTYIDDARWLRGSVDRRFTADSTDRDRVCRAETIAGGVVSPSGAGCTHTYDGFGNVKRIVDPDSSTRTFSYDAQGRPIRIEKGGATSTTAYDGFGEVARLEVFGVATGSRLDRRFGPLVEESQYTSGTSLIERRVPLPMDAVAVRRGAGPSAEVIYEYDDRGSARLFTDADGNVVQRVRYQPFGGIAQNTGTEGATDYTKYLWNGGDTLGAFGVVHIGARQYDPSSGRFLQRDPIAAFRNATSTHPYSFAFNDPVNFADLSGLDPVFTGRVYVLVEANGNVYVGHTAQELKKRFSNHRWKALFKQQSTSVYLYDADAELDVSGSRHYTRSGLPSVRAARKQALSAAEQTVMDDLEQQGHKLKNEIPAASASHKQTWMRLHNVSLRPRTMFRLGTRALGMMPDIPQVLELAGVLEGALTGEGGVRTYGPPYVLEDDVGQFLLVTGPGDGEYWKRYVTGGPANSFAALPKGFDVEISRDEYNWWLEEAKALWGYFDGAEFIPGLYQPTAPPSETYLYDKFEIFPGLY